jgi:hypothetical protein
MVIVQSVFMAIPIGYIVFVYGKLIGSNHLESKIKLFLRDYNPHFTNRTHHNVLLIIFG